MFLNPLLLFGTLGVLVPIVIHLLNRRRFVRVRWAAMRFVLASLEKNRRRMRMEDMLLLLVRCVIVAMLAMALARPVMRRAEAFFGPQAVTAVVLLDHSYSMGKNDGVKTRFEMARQAADEAVAGLPAGSSVAVLLLSDVVKEVIPQPTADLNLAREKIRKAELSDRTTNVLVGLKRAYQTLKEVAGAEKRVYLVTDGQALGWHRGAGAAGGTVADAGGGAGRGSGILQLIEENRGIVGVGIGTQVIVMPDGDTRNLAVSGVRLATELPTVNKALRFEVEVTNEGPAEVRDVPVRLYIDDSRAPGEEATIDVIPARSAKSVSLHARLREEGFHGVTARITTDALPADDARSMVVRVLKQVQVLLVDGEAGRVGREEDAFFVREALQPVGVDLRPSYFIQTRTITAGELPQTSLDSFDAVVLANVADVPQPTLIALERLVGEGRGLIVFPGPNVNAGFYSDVLYRQRGLLPAGLGEAVGDSGQGERFETLQTSRFEHPIMQLWNEEGRGNPGVAHFFRMFDLKVSGPESGSATGPATAPRTGGNVPGTAAVVARFANGKPAVVEHTFGQGRVVLFASTANTQWNDLPVRAAIFIPMMHRVLDSLLQRQDEHLSVQVGQKFVLRCAGELIGKEVLITRPVMTDETGMNVPDVGRVELAGSGAELAYEGTDMGGLYQVAIEGGTGEMRAVQFAVQPDTAESDLLPLSVEELAQMEKFAGVTMWQSGVALRPASTAQNMGTELWRPMAWAILALAVAESVMAFWFSRVK